MKVTLIREPAKAAIKWWVGGKRMARVKPVTESLRVSGLKYSMRIVTPYNLKNPLPIFSNQEGNNSFQVLKAMSLQKIGLSKSRLRKKKLKRN
jgi:hypothetical protein